MFPLRSRVLTEAQLTLHTTKTEKLGLLSDNDSPDGETARTK